MVGGVLHHTEPGAAATSEAGPVGWAGGFKSTELWPHWALSSRCDVLEPLEPKWHMARRSYEMICALFQASLVLYHKSLSVTA